MTDSQQPVPTPSYEVRQGAMLCHLAAFLGFVFPFGSVIGPLILWQMKREVDPFIDDQGKEALNFQITVAIAWMVCFVLAFAIIGLFLMTRTPDSAPVSRVGIFCGVSCIRSFSLGSREAASRRAP